MKYSVLASALSFSLLICLLAITGAAHVGLPGLGLCLGAIALLSLPNAIVFRSARFAEANIALFTLLLGYALGMAIHLYHGVGVPQMWPIAVMVVGFPVLNLAFITRFDRSLYGLV